jgi:hypothetical protein
VVLVEMGKDRGPDIVSGVAELVQSGARGLLRPISNPGQPAVWPSPSCRRGNSRGRRPGPGPGRCRTAPGRRVLDHIRVDRPGPVQRREASSHQKAGRRAAGWSGRICTWPVLTAGTRRIGLVASISGILSIIQLPSCHAPAAETRSELRLTSGPALPAPPLQGEGGSAPANPGRRPSASL